MGHAPTLTPDPFVGIKVNVKATLLLKERTDLGGAFVEVVIWHVPRKVLGSHHPYKYSLALIRDGACVLRYDNEAGKGDHRHIGCQQAPYHFTDLDALLRDFRAAIKDFLP